MFSSSDNPSAHVGFPHSVLYEAQLEPSCAMSLISIFISTQGEHCAIIAVHNSPAVRNCAKSSHWVFSCPFSSRSPSCTREVGRSSLSSNKEVRRVTRLAFKSWHKGGYHSSIAEQFSLLNLVLRNPRPPPERQKDRGAVFQATSPHI